ncbi:PHD finger protein rhinoceros [Frankliniella fusca]|uniref:PHD finger protein rhinoceros n=1 Tax=Frankliniella fusca TaxID=407009 RepID=A0AAE1HID9_9NEOP|nr:PHD finger protein rhinoceros [Frankliniella fusca]
MSQRVKRSLKSDDGPVPTKRRKGRPTVDDDDSTSIADSMGAWASRSQDSLKPPNIYNRTVAEAPAELFRKDLISAMKLADSEPLTADEYWVIGDQWKQEWERGVQVPVNPDSLPGPSVSLISHCPSATKPGFEFKLPKNKYIAICKDDSFDCETHILSDTPAKAEKACSYDLDDTDAAWLQIFNGERAAMGLVPVKEDQLERVMEELEMRCWDKIQTIVKNEESLGIEFDENVICDVCRSPDSEESNEMVFCDSCNICVHQACYGITTIPSGQWLCRTCALGKRPECVLCPNKMGAMKSTQSGSKWAHVSCALWIPEVSIGSVEKMEPITKISSIPQSRWALICVLCRERVGACIQCSVKSCKTAYHVTCAFKHGLEMKAIIEDDAADDGVKLRSYCQKHSVTSKDKKSSASSEDDESKRKKRKDMTSEERNQARAAKLQEIEAEFDKHVEHTDVKQCLDVDPEGILYIYNYWKLKRRAGGNKPLLAPKSDDVDLLSQKQEQADLDKMRMFVQLRQDLERVRNLCYMVSRREKLSRSFFRMREQTFHKQVAVLSDSNCSLSQLEIQAVIEANHGPSIYDRLYSHTTSESSSTDFDVILARITGLAVPEENEKPKTSELNGLVKSSGGRRSGMDNPYKRMYSNGISRRRSSLCNSSMSSGSETDSGAQPRKDSRLCLDTSASSSEDDKHTLERKPLRDRNETKVTSPSPSKSPHKSSRAAKPSLESGASSTEEEKPSPVKGGRLKKSSPSKNSEEFSSQPLSSKTASRLASLGLADSAGSCSEDEKPVLDHSKKSRNRKKPNTSLKKSAEKDKASIKAATMANLGLDSDALSTDDEKSVRKLSTDASTPVKKRGRKQPVTPAIVRRDSSSEDDETIRSSKSKSSQHRNHLKKSGPDSDVKMSVSEDSDNDLLIRSSSKTDSKKISIYSDSDSDSKDGSSSNMTADHHQNMMRTKGAMKEFVGLPSKSGSKSKKQTKSKIKDEDLVDDISKDKENIKSKKKDNAATDLIVPQRQAAKKASESIQKVSQGRMKDLDLEKELSAKPSSSEPDKNKAKSKAKDEEKKSRPGRDSKLAPDIYEFDKDPDAEQAEILAYVPQRQAAKKANEHMKTSIKKTDKDVPEGGRLEKGKKEVEMEKSKKPSKPEPRTKKISKSSSSSSSSSTSSSSSSGSSSSSSSSSDSDSESRSKSPAKKDVKAEKTPEPEFKKVTAKKEEWPFLDKESKSSESSSLDSDSDSDKDKDSKRPATRPKQSSKDKEGSSSQLAGKKSRKAPDKKLKTSDGRPELELQQPPSERNEPFRSKEKLGGNIRASSGGASDRLRGVESGPASRRSGNLSNFEEPISPKTSDTSRGRWRTKGTEESPRDRGRTGKQDSTPQKDQSKTGKRKPDEGKESSPDVKLGSPLRRSETPRRGAKSSSPSKEESKPKCSPTEIKKVSKKIDLQSPEREVERRKSTRNSSGSSPAFKNISEDLSTDSKVLRSPKSGFRSPKTVSSEIGLKHEEESLVKTMNSILTPIDKDVSVISNKKHSPRLEVSREKPILEESHASSSSSSSSSSSLTSNDDDGARKEKSQVGTGNKLPTEKNILSEELNQKITESVQERTKSCGLEANIDFPTAEQDSLEPKKINSRSSSLSGAPYQHRSIFSPQPPKDSGVSDLFDFQNDLYAVDDSVNDDGFGIPANSEEIMRAPLQFSFSNELLFKDDSKEDTTRETMNLVDKLRLSYSKQKSQPGGGDMHDMSTTISADTVSEQVDPDIEVVPIQPKPPIEEINLADEISKSQNSAPGISASVPSHGTPHAELQPTTTARPLHEKREAPVYHSPPVEPPFSAYSCAVEADKSKGLISAPMMGPAKTTQIEERWAPPSVYPEPSKEMQQQSSLGLPPHHLEISQLPHDPFSIQPQTQHQDMLPMGSEMQQSSLLHQDLDKSIPSHEKQTSMVAIGHDQFDSMGQTPHMDSPMPYSDHHSQAKWADSQVLPVRRDSTSDDTDSEDDAHNESEPLPPPSTQAPPAVGSDHMAPYPAPSLPYPPMPETPSYHPYSEAAPFVNSTPLFPPTFTGSNVPNIPNMSNIPNLSTIPNMSNIQSMQNIPNIANIPNLYHPPYGNFQDHSHGMMPSLTSKPEEPPTQQIPPPCTAAFTSSSHNMAFTAAMVSPLPTATPTPSPVLPQDPPLTPAAFPTSTAPPTPSPVLPHDTLSASTPYSSQTSLESQTIISASDNSHQLPSVANQNSKVASSVGKKTPTKPTRSSPRVISLQQKSPGKSPGKSPRQQEPVVVKPPPQPRNTSSSTKKPTKGPRGAHSQARGRGRGRGKGRGGFNELGICNKLAGTVFDLDFDDDDTDSVENLRAMRERRKSTDIKGSESSYQSQDSSVSPRFTSPSHVSSKLRSTVYQNQNLSDLRPPSPIHDAPSAVDDDDDVNPSPEPEETSDTSQMQNFNECVLPGPVDMRTYSSFESQSTSVQPTPFENNLGESLGSEPQEPDIADDIEKEIQQAVAKEKEKDLEEPRVSLPDSRQLLKVKIKGLSFQDANYGAAAPTVTPITQQQPAMPAVAPLDSLQGPGVASVSAMASVSASGTSNLRRMRKKELLRQYCSQDMNMDDAGAPSTPGHAVLPTPPVNRTVISIPKAVASMTTIPTREDYKAVVDANNEKKRKKDKTPNLSNSYARRNNPDALDYDDLESLSERRRSVGSNGSNNSFPSVDVPQPKRKGRAPRNSGLSVVAPEVAGTTKLKIKIGGNSTEVSLPVAEKKNLRVRPPKKRHTPPPAPAPSLAELRAESMKFREMVMKGFGGGEDDKEEPAVAAPVSKKKKKKKKNSRSSSPSPLPVVPEVQVITNEVAAPKLIIRFGNKGNVTANSGSNSTGNASVATGESGANQERTTEGIDKSVSDNQTDRLPTFVDTQSAGGTDTNKDANQTSNIRGDPDKNQTGDASALRKVRTSKSAVLPKLKLKLSRCEEGYVMKTREETVSNPDGQSNDVEPSPDKVHNMTEMNSSTLPLSQDCEVR